MSKEIKYGVKDLLPETINPADVSVRISMMIEGDLLASLKAKSAERHLPYQTMMKQMLRAALHQEDEQEEAAVEKPAMRNVRRKSAHIKMAKMAKKKTSKRA